MTEPSELGANIPVELPGSLPRPPPSRPQPGELPGSQPRPYPPPPQPVENITEIITQLERATAEAHTKENPATYYSYLAPQSKSISATGVISDAGTGPWQRWSAPRMTEVQVFTVTADVAIIHYRLDVKSSGWMSSLPVQQRRSSTWRKEVGTGEWKRVFHQASSIR